MNSTFKAVIQFHYDFAKTIVNSAESTKFQQKVSNTIVKTRLNQLDFIKGK